MRMRVGQSNLPMNIPHWASGLLTDKEKAEQYCEQESNCEWLIADFAWGNNKLSLKPTVHHNTAVNNTSICKYWKILFYPSNTDTGTFYGGSTDIDTDA